MNILLDMKDFFCCGNINIDNRKYDGYKYIVSDTSILIEKIIPHFDNYPLVGSKQLDYLDFKKAVLLINERNPNNLEKILDIKKKMNKKRSFEERWNYFNNLSLELKPEWIQAFIDGEGSFQCYISIKKNIIINPTLEIAQSNHDVEVLNAIKNFFGVGYLKPKYNIKLLNEVKSSRSVSRLIINQEEKVIEFFDKYSLFTNKQLDYLEWKTIVQLKSSNTHKTEEGLQSIINLKKGMNSGRILNSTIVSSEDKLNIIKYLDKIEK